MKRSVSGKIYCETNLSADLGLATYLPPSTPKQKLSPLRNKVVPSGHRLELRFA